MIANVGPDLPNNQCVNAVWTLRRRSWIVNGAVGRAVGVDFGGRRDISRGNTGRCSVAGSDIGRRGNDENGVGHRDIIGSDVTR